VRHALMSGELRRHLLGPAHDTVVVAAGSLSHIVMRQIRYAQQHIAQRGLNLRILIGEHFFAIAEGATLGHERIGVVFGATQFGNLLRQFVHSCTGSITLGRDVTQPHIESQRMVGLLERIWFGAARKGCTHHVRLRTQQPDINHDL
jgi:hypothetical protein